MIISNPPYIKSGILSELQPEVISYEPIIALDGGDDGMKFYRRILELSVKLLNLDGYVLFEIGFDQSQQIEELFKSFGIFDNIYIKEDYSGNPRVAVARRYK
jgi:release factor glutamine methyltransferase